MSKKRRKRRPRRPAPNPEPAQRAAEAPAPRRKSTIKDRPPAPWGSFPLVELVTLIGLAMIVIGLIVGGDRAPLLFGTGMVLCSLAGLELAIREHFAGYRSHSTLLAGVVAVAVLAGLFVLGPAALPAAARVGISAAAFALAIWGLATTFRRRSGRLVKLR
jgi:hypothetical protein